jgi:predicted MFS family arabinose efflux permease
MQKPISNTTYKVTFSRYQVFLIAMLAFMQFTVVLDFMVLSPLGAILMPKLSISTTQFGLVVSAYAFSAGASGLLSSGFVDRFDRKKVLLFFYTGFTIGTLLCGLATTYHFLLAARIFTGLFGGVIGSIGFAIIADLFAIQVRGRVMGFVQMAFALSQVLGIPIGLYLATEYDWHFPFLMIVALSVIVGIFLFLYLKPIDEHLKHQTQMGAFDQMKSVSSNPHYIKGFVATIFLATGGFVLMPFGSAYGVHNLGIPLSDLPILYMATGVCMLIFSPIIGKLSDQIGKYKMFLIGSIVTCIMTVIYCNLSITPFWIIIVLNVILFVGITGRMIASSALMTSIPQQKDRGAFMGINASIQQISGGIASLLAGLIVIENPDGSIGNYPLLGYVVIASAVLSVVLMQTINEYVTKNRQTVKP